MSNDESAAVAGDRSDDPTADVATDGRSAGTGGAAGDEPADRVDALAAQNHRLRTAYADATASQYRFTAVGLVGVGIVALLGALAFPSVREVLLAVGATGVVLGILSVYLAPSTDRPETLDATLYGTLAANQSGICTALGLCDERAYVPRGDGRVRLFVPRESRGDRPTRADLPSDAALADPVVGESVVDGPDSSRGTGSPRGAAFDPTGASLVTELETSDGELAGLSADRAADRLADALAGRFRLIERVDAVADAEAGEARVTVGENALAPVDGFDHPVVSVVGVGLARALDQPVTVAVESDDGEDGDGDDGDGVIVVCRWSPGDEVDGGDSQ